MVIPRRTVRKQRGWERRMGNEYSGRCGGGEDAIKTRGYQIMPDCLITHGMCPSSKESSMKSPSPGYRDFCLHNQYWLLETAFSTS